MLAIVDLNGKQYQIEEGRYITVDRLAMDVDHVFEIGNVLAIVDGEDSLVGAPFVEGATVKAKVLRHDRGPKILVYKMRCKKGYRRKNGHRQDFTQIQIEGVTFPGRKEKPAKAAEATEKPKAAKKPAAAKAKPAAESAAPESSEA
jgi:large subunit ribosomal protein L21